MTGQGSHAPDSVERLAERMASIPAQLRLAATIPLPELRDRGPRRIVTTGIGASEGPARLLATTLLEGGVAALFVPLSHFAIHVQEGALLVVFSQNLSPNARLALQGPHRFDLRWLVTSVSWEARASHHEALFRTLCDAGVVPIVIPPAAEDGMLVRVVGPTVAALIALRIAASLGVNSQTPFELAGQAYTAPSAMASLGESEIALVAAGVSIEALHGQRWKLLEGLLRGDPPVWDLLQVAHGPLQWFYERDVCLLVLATPAALPLLERLARTLTPRRHRLIPIVSARSDALAFFEHAAAIDDCLLATLRAQPRNLFDWPGRGEDAALYGLGDAPP